MGYMNEIIDKKTDIGKFRAAAERTDSLCVPP